MKPPQNCVSRYSRCPPTLEEDARICRPVGALKSKPPAWGEIMNALPIAKCSALSWKKNSNRPITSGGKKTRWTKSVTADNIAQVVEQWTGIPVQSMLETESEKLLRMEEVINERVIGQEKAIAALSDAIRRARSGLKDPKRPIGSFIFLGSSGVGKTELAKALAEFMFDDEDNLVRVDMSEYREKHTVSRLFGAPPGYVGYEAGGQLTEVIRRRPYRVILFDEIEKAHPDVWSVLLQVLEDGRMTDGQGHTVDFRNTVLIMTSNLGTEFARHGGALGFLQQDEDAVADHRKIEKAMRDTFRPEFLNRIDEIIIFEPLTLEAVEQMVDLQIRELAERMDESGLAIHLTEPARFWLAKQGYRPAIWRATAAPRHSASYRKPLEHPPA